MESDDLFPSCDRGRLGTLESVDDLIPRNDDGFGLRVAAVPSVVPSEDLFTIRERKLWNPIRKKVTVGDTATQPMTFIRCTGRQRRRQAGPPAV